MTTLTAKELYEKYLNDLEALRNACPHENTEWMSEEWAPGHSTGAQVKVCLTCEKTLDRQSTALNLTNRMFIETHQDYECSQCSARNIYETVTRGNEIIMRCRVCGHEKVTAVLSTASTGGPGHYTIDIPPSVIKF